MNKTKRDLMLKILRNGCSGPLDILVLTCNSQEYQEVFKAFVVEVLLGVLVEDLGNGKSYSEALLSLEPDLKEVYEELMADPKGSSLVRDLVEREHGN